MDPELKRRLDLADEYIRQTKTPLVLPIGRKNGGASGAAQLLGAIHAAGSIGLFILSIVTLGFLAGRYISGDRRD